MLVGKNSVFYNLKEAKLEPKERHCFDKKINYRGLVNNKPVEGCYYVNTTDGFVAKREDRNNTCNSLLDFTTSYRMTAYSMHGDAFMYQIDRRNQRRFTVIPAINDLSGTNPSFEISNKHDLEREGEKLTDHNLPTYQYHIRESSQRAVYHLFAPYNLELIKLQDYLGMYGTGYYKDDYGNTILSLLMISDPQNYIRIEKISEVDECFDGATFESLNDENAQAEREISERKKDDLEKREKDVASSSCSTQQTQLINLERKMQENSDRAMNIAKSGKPFSPTDVNVLLEGNNVADETEKKILERKMKICHLSEMVSSKNVTPQAKQKYTAEIECHTNSIAKLNMLKAELEAIQTTDPKQKPRVLAERNKTYLSRISQIDLGCNAGKSGNIKAIPEVKNPIPDSKNPFKKLKNKL